jgi:two-component system, OmpR family, response regulator
MLDSLTAETHSQPGSAPSRPRILVVDDNDNLRQFVSQILLRQGFEVTCAPDGDEMDIVLMRQSIDLILLDSVMPKEDGISILKRLSVRPGPPVIMLSARSEDIDRIHGLEMGADDYVAKPFNPDELVARIRAVLRRQSGSQSAPAETVSRFFGWELDNIRRQLKSPADKVLVLSNAEFALMRVFVESPGKPLSREQIMRQMNDMEADTIERAVDSLISRLRRKMDRANPGRGEDEALIRTIYGTGYMMRPLS